METPRNTALVVRVNNERFFYKWNRKGHMQTAWSLAGARTYLPTDIDRCIAIQTALEESGHNAEIMQIQLQPSMTSEGATLN